LSLVRSSANFYFDFFPTLFGDLLFVFDALFAPEDDLLFVFEALFAPEDFTDLPALPVPFVPASPPVTVLTAAVIAPAVAPFAAPARTSVAISLAFFKTADVVLFDFVDFLPVDVLLPFFAGITFPP